MGFVVLENTTFVNCILKPILTQWSLSAIENNDFKKCDRGLARLTASTYKPDVMDRKQT